MANRHISEEQRGELLEKCFACCCEYGLDGVSTSKLAAACGVSSANLFYHFGSIDNIILEATAHGMAKVEDDIITFAPQSLGEAERFLREMPRRMAERHAEKFRLMYQVYLSPKYREQGLAFQAAVSERYRRYAERFSPQLGIPVRLLQGFIYLLVRTCVFYCLFGDEECLETELDVLRLYLHSLPPGGAGPPGG